MWAPKNFYNAVDQAKLGIDQIPEMVKDIADIKEDISEITPLPDVTSADNGDVLTVIEGAWGKGSSKINKTTLYTGDTLANTITLSDGVSNYSALLISFHALEAATHIIILDSRIFNVEDLSGVQFGKYDNDRNYIYYSVTDDNELTLASQAGSNWHVAKITGIK